MKRMAAAAFAPSSPAARSGSVRRAGLYALLAALAIVSLTYQVRSTIDQVAALRSTAPSARSPFQVSGDMAVIMESPEAKAAGLQVGDRLVQINGVALQGTNSVRRAMAGETPGQKLHIIALHAGKMHSFDLSLAGSTDSGSRAVDVSTSVIVGILMPWFSTLLGFYVAAVRPRDPLAWIVLAVMLSFSALVETSIFMWADWIRIPAETYRYFLIQLWPLFLFLFGYYFPQPLEIERTKPWLKWCFVAPFLLVTIFAVPIQIAGFEGVRSVAPLNTALHPIWQYLGVSMFLFVGLGIAFVAWKTFRGTSRDARRRARLLFAGMFVSITPIVTLILISIVSGRPMDSVPVAVLLFAVTIIIVFPATLAHVILVNRALDVRVVLRQGLQYTFARGGLVVFRVASICVVIGIGYWVTKNYARSLASQVLLVSVLLGISFAGQYFVTRIGAWVDRRFFREQYDAELILAELSGQVSRIRETQPLLASVCERIAKTLHVSRISVLLDRNGAFETFYALGFSEQPNVAFSGNSGLVAHLKNTKDAQLVYFDDEMSWLYRTPGIDEQQRSFLADLGAELLLPLSARDHLLGFIAAGQKRSEEPYSKSDVRMLASVANQTGLALENAELTTAIAAEMAHRESLAREVEIAREVQERLFPQTLPEMPGLDFDGYCRTALGVGGDYYDFLLLSGNRLGFAVGDVAGKGISAALLMASLQASLRGETYHGSDDLAAVIANINRRVYEASTTNRYATFFFGRFDPATRRLCYVNAGHNPPILMRHTGAGWEARILEATGTVIGLLPLSVYEECTVDLASGDYLAAYTDGISEAMNPRDEEWGEDCLTEALRACAQASLSAHQTIRRILSAADTFASGAKQHDDMTLVVLRVL